jgi:hypothetical protein
VLAERKLNRLRPWAWGPDSVEFLAPLFGSVTGEPRPPEQCFNERIAALYSKAWSAEFLRAVLSEFDPACVGLPPGFENHLCPADVIGTAVTDLPSAMEAIAAIRARGHLRVVVKEALGLAGSNALRLWEPELLPNQRRWLERAFEAGRTLVVEPWLERLADFSVQLESTPRGLKSIGFATLHNDLRGQYRGNEAAPHFAVRLPESVTQHFCAARGVAGGLPRFYEWLSERLELRLREAGFVGPVGIDALVYRDVDGHARLKPVVEINPRYTMGRVTLELMQAAAPGSHGAFQLVSRKEAGGDFVTFARTLAERAPLVLEGEPVPRLRSGTVCLNDPAAAQVVLAIFTVSRTREGFGQRGATAASGD